MLITLIRRSPPLLAIALSIVMPVAPARAADVLFTFGEMLRLQELPLEAAKRSVTGEEEILYQNFEFYAYTVFEALQVANDAARMNDQKPLFCAPPATFYFRKEGDIARLADYVTSELFALAEDIGGTLDRYDEKPASAVLLLGLRAAFPCPGSSPQLAQR